jgi:outer membrane protein assembly factor BamB
MQQLLTVGGGIVYAVSGTSSGWFNGTSYFTALNASTGAMMVGGEGDAGLGGAGQGQEAAANTSLSLSQQWTKTIDSTVLVSLPVVLGDGSLIAAYFSYETLLFYISKFSARGDLLWSITITMSPGNRILQGRSNDIVPLYDGPFTSNRDGTRVFFALGDQISVVVNALDVTNGSILWTAGYQFGVAEESVFLAVGPQDDLYVADPGHLVAYGRDGNQKWAVPLSFLDDSVVQPVANWRDGNLYIACDCSRDGTLFAFDSNTGRLLWGVPLQGATFLNSLPTIDTAGNIFVASSTTLAAFRSSGELLWQQTNLGGAYLSGDISAGCNCRPPFSYQRCLAACVLR